MWHRYTEDARRIIFHAREEAERSGEQYVGPEHLLLGLLRVADTEALPSLRGLGVDSEPVRRELERLRLRGPRAARSEVRLSPRGKQVLERARSEARLLGNLYIQPAHLFLALIQDSGPAGQVLCKLGADLERARGEAESGTGSSRPSRPRESAPGEPAPPPPMPPPDDPVSEEERAIKADVQRLASERAGVAVMLSQGEAARMGADEARSEHLLLALTRGSGYAAMQILEKVGLHGAKVRQEIMRQCRREIISSAPDLKPRRRMPLSSELIGALEIALQAREKTREPRLSSRHLLLGLLHDEEGGAARVLKALGADLDELRRLAETEAIGDAVPEPWETPSYHSLGSQSGGPGMWQRFTERARRVVFFAQEEAARLGEHYVGTEHLLLGLVREEDSVAARILEQLGVPLGSVRHDLERQVTRGHGGLGQDMQLTPRGKRVIDLAYEEARQLNNNYIGTEHLLLGLIREGDGLAARVLVKLGADLELARRAVYAMQEGEGAQGSSLAARPFLTDLRQRLQRTRGRDEGGEPLRMGAPGSEATRPDLELQPPIEVLRWLAEQSLEALPRLVVTESLATAIQLARQICEGVTDLRSVQDLTADQAWALVCLARVLKHSLRADKTCQGGVLAGKTLAMIFEKPSLRTRVSFEAGMFQLGGHAIYLQPSDISLGKRESVADVARNLERMVDGIMARVFSHATVLELAEHARVPVINGLCDREHPCQALADLLTVWEHRGEIAGQKIAYVGDGNNVAHSLMLLGAMLGAHVALACPDGYAPDAAIEASARTEAECSGGSVTVTQDPYEACRDADVVYTDVWTSMGQEEEASERSMIFAPYQINEALIAVAKPDFLFLHCLPAHRGEEVTAAVMDGPHSAVFDQAENRLHAQKAALAVLMG